MAFDIERIHKAARRVRNFLKKNSRRPSADAVHHLRTSTRSLETTLTTLGLDSKKRVARLLRDLGKVRRRAGKVRDMDVLTANAMSAKPHGEKACRVLLLEHLGAERRNYDGKLRRVIEKTGPHLRRDLKKTATRLEKLLRQADSHAADSDAAPVAMAKSIKLATDLQRPARLGRTNLHPYRLKVKELRNVLLLSDQGDDQEFVQQLEGVKDAIGEWHDWEELVAIATKTLDHGPSCALIKELKTSCDEKYESALSLTEHLRSHYLAIRVPKRKGHRARKAAISTTVLRAASTIA
jgi:CHAD domain-containing protein